MSRDLVLRFREPGDAFAARNRLRNEYRSMGIVLYPGQVRVDGTRLQVRDIPKPYLDSALASARRYKRI